MTPLGMIHGRFQPFHRGHHDYLLAALERCRRLIVGITNPWPADAVAIASDSHRHRADANPYSFYLRSRMIQESILANPACASRFADVIIVPFPIHTPDSWSSFVPGRHVVQFMRLLDPWDWEKKAAFEAYGFPVVVLEGERVASGTEVRADLATGRDGWRGKVPPGAAEVLQRWLEGDR